MVLATEWLASWLAHSGLVAPIVVIGLVRLFQIAAICWIVSNCEGGLAAVGWAPATWVAGIKKGAVWSLAFGLFAAVAMAMVHLTGNNPLRMVKSPLPAAPLEIGMFFVVGALIAPVAEELCFRGILYSFFRRWGIIAAVLASTAIFVGLHSIHGIPLTQIAGGLVFAMAYETSGNLMVPIIIHCTGNLAIFTISLL